MKQFVPITDDMLFEAWHLLRQVGELKEMAA